MQITKYTDRVLLLIKNKGPQTAATMATLLGMTSMGVRQHLQILERRHLVVSYDHAKGVGRPKRYWRLTELAQEHFPDGHGELSQELLSGLLELYGQAGINRLLEISRTQRLTAYHEFALSETTLHEKVIKLTHLRRQEGYMAEYQANSDGSFFLQENHCPIAKAASCCEGLCASELKLFQAFLGQEANVKRESHILSGARNCAYTITAA